MATKCPNCSHSWSKPGERKLCEKCNHIACKSCNNGDTCLKCGIGKMKSID